MTGTSPANQQSRSLSFFGGAFFGYVYQACAMLVGLWLTPLYIRLLGTHDYGIWLVSLQLLSVLLLCDFGVIGVVARDVARITGESNETAGHKLNLLIAQTFKVVLVQTVLVAAAASFIYFTNPVEPRLRGFLGLILVVFVISYPLRLFPALLQGLQDLQFLGGLRVWLWALSTAVVVLLLFAGAKFFALACGWCIQQLGHDLGAYLRWRKNRAYVSLEELWRIAGRFDWRWFTRGFWVSVGQLAYTLVSGADLLIIARVFGPSTVVIYSCTSKLTMVLQNQPQLLAAAALPGLSQMRKSESPERTLQAVVSLTQALLLLVGAVFCVVLALNKAFIKLWIGPEMFGGMVLTVVLLMNFVVRQIDYTLALALFAFGREKESAWRAISDGLGSAALAFLFSRHYGLPGIALGFLCGALFIALPIDAFLLTRELSVPVWRLFKPYVPYIWRMAAVGAASFLIVNRVSPMHFATLVAAGAAVGVCYFLIAWPYLRRTPLYAYVERAARVIRTSIGLRRPLSLKS